MATQLRDDELEILATKYLKERYPFDIGTLEDIYVAVCSAVGAVMYGERRASDERNYQLRYRLERVRFGLMKQRDIIGMFLLQREESAHVSDAAATADAES